MNAKKEPLNPEQKADAAEIAAVLRGAPVNGKLLCSLMAGAYVAGVRNTLNLYGLDELSVRRQATEPGA